MTQAKALRVFCSRFYLRSACRACHFAFRGSANTYIGLTMGLTAAAG